MAGFFYQDYIITTNYLEQPFSSTNTSWELVRKAGDTRGAQIKDVSNHFIHPQQPTTLLIVTVFKFTFNLNALCASDCN